jgi:hypothetical protein
MKAQIEFCGELKRLEVDGHFDVAVPNPSAQDTTFVADMKHDRSRLEYRLIEGRLFRSFPEYDAQA